MLYSRKRTLMYKILIRFFSSSFITRIERMSKVREDGRRLSYTLRGQGTNLRWNLFSFLQQIKTFLVILYPGPTHNFSWTHLLPAVYTKHVITFISSMPPTQFTRYFRREYLRPVYFRYQVYSLLFLFPVSGFRSCIDRCQRSHQVNINYSVY